jgi:hypothetical protein
VLLPVGGFGVACPRLCYSTDSLFVGSLSLGSLFAGKSVYSLYRRSIPRAVWLDSLFPEHRGLTPTNPNPQAAGYVLAVADRGSNGTLGILQFQQAAE